MASTCPVCRKAMLILELDAIEIDQCLSCGGIWLDAGELEAILRAAGDEPARLHAAIQSAEPAEGHGKRRCPRCRKKLAARQLREPGVTIDLCPRGDGLWLDRGELQALAGPGANAGPIATFLGQLFEHELSAKAEGGST